MNEFIKELIMIMGSYFGVIILLFAGLNFFSSGWLFTWLKVKLSRGRKVLISVVSVTDDYFRAGIIDKGFLVFTDKNKDERRVSLPPTSIYRSIGINMVTVDDEKNSVLTRSFNEVSGFDAVKYSNLYVRALYKPNIFDSKEKILMVIAVVTIIAVLVVGFLVYTQGAKIDSIMGVIGKLGSIKEVL